MVLGDGELGSLPRSSILCSTSSALSSTLAASASARAGTRSRPVPFAELGSSSSAGARRIASARAIPFAELALGARRSAGSVLFLDLVALGGVGALGRQRQGQDESSEESGGFHVNLQVLVRFIPHTP
jgi:hypothetical protein